MTMCKETKHERLLSTIYYKLQISFTTQKELLQFVLEFMRFDINTNETLMNRVQEKSLNNLNMFIDLCDRLCV